MLVGTPDTVKDAYKEAIAKNEKDWFALNSSRAQLQLLQDLGFRPETVAAGIATFDRALGRLTKPEDRWEPRQVLLFSGHMVDAPDRKTPRFPAGQGGRSRRRRSKEALERLGAGPDDLAFCQAAAGGDLLFLEACQKRGVRCRVLLPFDEPEFIEKSIVPSAGGDKWRDRFYADEGEAAGTDPHHARRARPAAGERRSVRALQSMAAVLGARVRHRQGAGSSRCGTAAAETVRAAPRTCTTRSSAGPGGSPG